MTENHVNASAQNEEQLAQTRHQMETVSRVSQALFCYTELDEIVEVALRSALEEVNAEAGSILLADPESKQLVFRVSIGEKPVPRGTAIPWDQGIAGQVFQTGKPVSISHVAKSGTHYSAVDQLTGFTTRDMISLPLRRWKGEPIGVLNVLNKRSGVLNENDLMLLTIISSFAALAIMQAQHFEDAKKAEMVNLLGDIGHDLKNLLQPVVSGTWLLKEEIEDAFANLPAWDPVKKQSSKEICDEALGMIRRTGERIHDRVKEIADCVKGLSAPPEFKPCNVAKVVEDALQTLRVLATEKDIALHCKDLDILPTILADERRLYNGFYNLVNNAIPEVPGGGTITISGQADPSIGVIHLSIADTGRGMPPEIRDRLFTRRAVSTKAKGTGLGTKIVKDVVDAHRGQITVESELGLGTTFRIRLPVDPTRIATEA